MTPRANPRMFRLFSPLTPPQCHNKMHIFMTVEMWFIEKNEKNVNAQKNE